MPRKATTKATKTTKKVKTEETPVAVEETPVVVVDEPKVEVKVDPEAFDNSEETTEKKKVKVRLVKDFSTNIGGKFWEFKGGKVVSVPENVKFVLARAGLLDVL